MSEVPTFLLFFNFYLVNKGCLLVHGGEADCIGTRLYGNWNRGSSPVFAPIC